MSWETPQLTKVRGGTLCGVVNLFLLLKVSDKNNSQIGSMDLSSFEMQFLSCCYYTQTEFGKMIANLVAHMTQFTVWQKDWYSFRYGFLKFDVLLIDFILKVNVYTSLTFGAKHAQIVQPNLLCTGRFHVLTCLILN